MTLLKSIIQRLRINREAKWRYDTPLPIRRPFMVCLRRDHAPIDGQHLANIHIIFNSHSTLLTVDEKNERNGDGLAQTDLVL